MDAAFWLRLLTFGYATLRRAARIDIPGWTNFEARKDAERRAAGNRMTEDGQRRTE